jgi:hypothetical protein
MKKRTGFIFLTPQDFARWPCWYELKYHEIYTEFGETDELGQRLLGSQMNAWDYRTQYETISLPFSLRVGSL